MRFDLPSPRQSQPLLVRIAASVAAVICLGVLLAIGTVALAVLAVAALAFVIWFRWRLHKLRKQVAEQAGTYGPTMQDDNDDVIEGEYVVVNEHHHDNVH